jgi:hypothetical protein
MIVTQQLVDQLIQICCDCAEAKLRAYQIRPGNSNSIQFATFGSARAMRFPSVGAFNRVYGFGPKLLEHLPSIIRFYAETQTAFELWMAPTEATELVTGELVRCGFVPWNYHTKFYADLDELEPLVHPSRVEVEQVGAAQLEEYLDVLLAGWGFPQEHLEAAKDNMRLRLTIPGIYLFMARLEGRPIGGAVLYRSKETAYLAEAAVRVEDRNRGGQLKLMEARLQFARELGCKLVVGGADFGNSSFRNMQRIGLKIAFTDITWHHFADRVNYP